MLIQSTNGARGKDPRSVRRTHQWAKPRESVVDSLLSHGQLDQILAASTGLYADIPILGLPQVLVYDGMLVPVVAGGGFSSIEDLVAKERLTGYDSQYYKSGLTGIANGAGNTLWYSSGSPAVGATPGAAPTGTNCTNATLGALPFRNPPAGEETYIAGAVSAASVANNTLLLYDRIWHSDFSVTVDTAFTMTPARYATTGSTGTSVGNFFTYECRSSLGAGYRAALEYVDQDGNTAEFTGVNSGTALATGQLATQANASDIWYPLAAGDTGISEVISLDVAAGGSSGSLTAILGHPLAFIPQPVASTLITLDGINSAFHMQRVYDNACMALFEIRKPSTSNTAYHGVIHLVSG